MNKIDFIKKIFYYIIKMFFIIKRCPFQELIDEETRFEVWKNNQKFKITTDVLKKRMKERKAAESISRWLRERK